MYLPAKFQVGCTYYDLRRGHRVGGPGEVVAGSGRIALLFAHCVFKWDL
jgi:hypothetical protein